MENTEQKIPFWHVDAFTNARFEGNPAAVCLYKQEQPPNDPVMQKIAAEMNLSETAFVWPLESEGGIARFGLKWFTPSTEVKLCGHATLAAAWVLFEELAMEGEAVEFKTASGILRAAKTSGKIGLDLPIHASEDFAPPEELLAALGGVDVCDAQISPQGENVLLRLKDEAAVRAVTPDFRRLENNKSDGVRGIIVTAEGSGEYDFVSRYFAPWCGINEDPVTGSAHCMLAPYWAKSLKKDFFFAHQASMRGGDMGVRLDRGRVFVVGDAVVVVRGELLL